jgi:putative effector of murein hydrolase LrgA (UPF0299 family)
MPTHPVYRAARSVVFATVCVGLAITGHMVVSHATVPVPAAVGGLVALTVIGVALTGTERSLATILTGLLGGQFMLHAVFTAAQQGQHLEHGHAMPSSSGAAAMTFAHVAAAVVSAWWLRRGERAVWGLARRIAAALRWPARALRAPSLPLSAAPRRRVATAMPGRRGAVLRHVVVRRGPPSPSTALS